MSTDIASYIDHTLLKPTCTLSEIEKLCAEARQYQFAAVCVPPYFLKQAKEFLEGSNVKLATVIGFPLGYNSTTAKITEMMQAIVDGADELDVVHNLTAVKNGNWELAVDEVNKCITLAHNMSKVIKVIVESGLLTDTELIRCCQMYGVLGADFIKTSTGYASAGASVHAVEIMRKNLPEAVSIKASGGIRDAKFAQQLIDAGANRLGCSASVAIVKG